jgi:hypothetical protein
MDHGKLPIKNYLAGLSPTKTQIALES